jgi:hypothetical protein
VCETTMRRRYLISLGTYLSHSPIDRKAFSAPFRSVQQANCAVQPTAGEGGDGTVSTVSVAGTHTLHPQCTPVHQDGRAQTFSLRGWRTAPNIASTSTERLAIGMVHSMYTTYWQADGCHTWCKPSAHMHTQHLQCLNIQNEGLVSSSLVTLSRQRIGCFCPIALLRVTSTVCLVTTESGTWRRSQYWSY